MGIKAAVGIFSIGATLALGSSVASGSDSYVGTTRWVNSRHFVFVCDTSDFLRVSTNCHKVKAGTALKILSIAFQNTKYVEINVGYMVEEPTGKQGYVRSGDAIFMSSAQEKKEADLAAVDCKKRGGINIGMTSVEVQSSCWGKPRKVNQTITASGNHEQWVYGGGYVYLEDGIVTSIQTTR